MAEILLIIIGLLVTGVGSIWTFLELVYQGLHNRKADYTGFIFPLATVFIGVALVAAAS